MGTQTVIGKSGLGVGYTGEFIIGRDWDMIDYTEFVIKGGSHD